MSKKHYSQLEKTTFLQFLKRHKDVIEARRSAAATNAQKERAWSKVLEEFNNSAYVGQERTSVQLKKLWTNLKQKQRNTLTKERQERLATGGGPEPAASEVDPDVVTIVPHLMETAPVRFSSNIVAQSENGESSDGDEDEVQEKEEENDNENDEEEKPQPGFSGQQRSQRTRSVEIEEHELGPKRKISKKMDKQTEEKLRIQRLENLIAHDRELFNLKFRNAAELHAVNMKEAHAKADLAVLTLNREMEQN